MIAVPFFRRVAVERAKSLGRRFVKEDRGQDLVEYGLLGAIVAVMGALVLPNISTRMAALFTNWGANVNNHAVPPDPLP